MKKLSIIFFTIFFLLILNNLVIAENVEIKLVPNIKEPELQKKPKKLEKEKKNNLKEKQETIQLPEDLLKEFDKKFIEIEENESNPNFIKVEKQKEETTTKKPKKEEKVSESWFTSFKSKISTLGSVITHKLAEDKLNTKKTFKRIIGSLKTSFSNASVKFELQKKNLSRKMKNFIENAKKLFEKEPSIKLDLNENEDEIIVILDAPGVQKNNIKIIVENENEKNFLVVSGKFKKDDDDSIGQKKIIKERKFGTFKRKIEIKSKIKQEGIIASLDQGILLIKIPKEKNQKFNVKIK